MHKIIDVYIQSKQDYHSLILDECNYVKKYILKVKLNESSWNFLRGIWNKYCNIRNIHECIRSL